MRDTHLVLIEGPVGAGKSTTAELLAERMQATNMNVAQLHGFDPSHPIRTRCERSARRLMENGALEVSPRDPQDATLHTAPQWAALSRDLRREGRVLIAEGKYFQQCLEYVFLLGATESEIFAEQQRIIAACESSAPLLIYLDSTDRRDTLQRAIEERPDGWLPWLGGFLSLHPWAKRAGISGPDVVAAFYEAWAPIERELFARHPHPKLLLTDSHLDWPAAQARIDAFLMGDSP